MNREERESKESNRIDILTFVVSTIAFQLTHTISIQSNTKIQVNKGSLRTDIARWLVVSLRLFTDRVSPRGRERVRPD